MCRSAGVCVQECKVYVCRRAGCMCAGCKVYVCRSAGCMCAGVQGAWLRACEDMLSA